MRIAVDIRNWRNKDYRDDSMYQLIEKHPEQSFILFASEVVSAALPVPHNATIFVLRPSPANLLSYKWWYDVKLPAALKKQKADLFIGASGLLSLRTAIPQVLLVDSLGFVSKTKFFPGTGVSFYKKYTAAFVKKAASIVAVSEFGKAQLVLVFKGDETKIILAGKVANKHFQPLEWEQKEKVKDQYTGGCEYFIFNSQLSQGSNLFNVLKAFSLFKKWQKTNMKLVVTGTVAAGFEPELKKLETYKYRDQLVLKINAEVEERALLMAAAYALVYPPAHEGFPMPLLEAMYSQIPVITSEHAITREVAGDSALYTNASEPEDIAQKMKLIFKDEQLRNNLIANCEYNAARYSGDNVLRTWWQLIQKAVSS